MEQNNIHLSLIQAARENNIELVRIYLQSGADSATMDLDGNSALHYAVQNKNKDIISALLISGMDEHLRNKKDQSAIDLVNQDVDLAAWFIQCSRAIRLAQLHNAIKDIATVNKKLEEQAEMIKLLSKQVAEMKASC